MMSLESHERRRTRDADDSVLNGSKRAGKQESRKHRKIAIVTCTSQMNPMMLSERVAMEF